MDYLSVSEMLDEGRKKCFSAGNNNVQAFASHKILIVFQVLYGQGLFQPNYFHPSKDSKYRTQNNPYEERIRH